MWLTVAFNQKTFDHHLVPFVGLGTEGAGADQPILPSAERFLRGRLHFGPPEPPPVIRIVLLVRFIARFVAAPPTPNIVRASMPNHSQSDILC